jgi:hypothetical protein
MIDRNIYSFRRRFVKDFNLPINLVDSPYFEYYVDRYDFFPKEDMENVISKIDNEFGGSIEKWLEFYSKIRDRIITTIESSDAFKEFNNANMKEWAIPSFNVGDLNIYNNSNTGKSFISIDLKKANFQSLRNFNSDIVMGCKDYDELIDYFGGDEYFKKSKYTRQVIFGKLNPKRTIQFEKYLIGTIFTNKKNNLFKYLYDNTELITVKSDEIVFRIDNSDIRDKIDKNFLQMLSEEIKLNNDLNVSVNAFTLSRIVCENHNGATVDCYMRHFYCEDEHKYDLKSVSSIFFPQIYAFSKGLDITDMDLYFRAEDQTAKFCHPLQLIEIQR